MTGFGRARGIVQGYPLICEVRSLNHRFLDIQLRIPRYLEPYEGEIRKFLTRYFERGAITLRLYWEVRDPALGGLKVNQKRAKAYLQLFKRLKQEYNLKGEVDLSFFTQLDGIIVPDSEGKPKGWVVAKKLLTQATSKLIQMRETEGKAIGRQLTSGVQKIEKSLHWIEKRGGLRVEERRERLKKRMGELVLDGVDEVRLHQEVLLFSERCDVEEEKARLRSHLGSFKKSLQQSGVKSQRKGESKRLRTRVGRRLDFLLQEMNREANTLSSKASDARVSLEVVKIKEELEKIRKQVQNIE